LYDGGDVQVTPAPFYSIAEAKRKQGKYAEAVAEIRKQLARFPGDFAGTLMLAGIQAENLNDLPGAQMTIERLLNEPDQPPANLVKHLEQHPQDGEARERLALIYAEHYHRVDLAVDQLEELLAQPNLPAKQAVHWLNLLADLRVRRAGDVAAAREALQRVVDLFPGSAAAENAKHRMAHLQLELRSGKSSQVVKL